MRSCYYRLAINYTSILLYFPNENNSLTKFYFFFFGGGGGGGGGVLYVDVSEESEVQGCSS